MARKPHAESGAEPAPSFEQNLDKLELIVRRLEQSDIPLEDALALFESGMNLSAVCKTQLQEAERRVQMLIKRGDSITLQDMDAPVGPNEEL